MIVNPVDTAPRTCWSCRGPVATHDPFCATCGAVQPPGATDPFTRLGLARDYAVDQAALTRRYFDLQRRLHPDRFAGKSARERAFSQQQAAALNEAYESLKNPLARAASMLRLAGREAAFEGQGTISDPKLLAEAMEMREALEEAAAPDDAVGVLARAETDVATTGKELADAFAVGDLDRAESSALRLKYLTKLADEARQRVKALV